MNNQEYKHIEELITNEFPSLRYNCDFILTLWSNIIIKYFDKIETLQDEELIRIIHYESKVKRIKKSLGDNFSDNHKDESEKIKDEEVFLFDRVDREYENIDMEEDIAKSDRNELDDEENEENDKIIFFKNKTDFFSYINPIIARSNLNLEDKTSIIKCLENEDEDLSTIQQIIMRSNLNELEKRKLIILINSKDIADFILNLTEESNLNFIEKESIKSFYDKGYDSFLLANFTNIGKSRIFSESYRKFLST